MWGFREDELKLAIQQGRQTDFLREKFEQFGAAAQLNVDLLSTNLSTLESIVARVGRTLGEELTTLAQSAIKDLVGDLQDSEKEIDLFAKRLGSAIFDILTTINAVAEGLAEIDRHPCCMGDFSSKRI